MMSEDVNADKGPYILPCSFNQEKILNENNMVLDGTLHNVQRAARLQGNLNLIALEKSINSIISRHEILRTTYTIQKGMPVQVIYDNLYITTSITDISDANNAEYLAAVFIEEDFKKRFDLNFGPVIRVSLIKLAEQEHILLITIHQIAVDCWSMALFRHELSYFYNSFSHDKKVALPDLAIQYADYSVWQRNLLQGKLLEEHVAYWRHTLYTAQLESVLLSDRPRLEASSYIGESVEFELKTTLVEKLSLLNQKFNVTFFMTLIAIFKILIYGHSQQTDICIGYPVLNRNKTELQNMLGFFSNELVLRTNINPNQSFDYLLNDVREAVINSDGYKDAPLEILLTSNGNHKDNKSVSLCNIMFTLNNIDDLPADWIGLTLNPILRRLTIARFDLTLSFIKQENKLLGSFEYRRQLFDRGTIELMVENYISILEIILINPNIKIENLPLNRNTKIGRNLRNTNRANLGVDFIAPRSKIEQLLADIWAEVLKMDQVGIHDNFFALGGNSLLATKVVVRIGEKISVTVPIRVLFDAPTVLELATKTELLLANQSSQTSLVSTIKRQSRTA